MEQIAFWGNHFGICSYREIRELSAALHELWSRSRFSHNSCRHFHWQNVQRPVAFQAIGANIQTNGREIFQEEKQTRFISERRKRNSKQRSGN
jgi:hypothetical protein